MKSHYVFKLHYLFWRALSLNYSLTHTYILVEIVFPYNTDKLTLLLSI